MAEKDAKRGPLLSVLIPVTANESTCLPETLRSVNEEIIRSNTLTEIIVIANCCKGTSDIVANKVFNQKDFEHELVSCDVIYCETPGKMFAVNDGIRSSSGDYLVLIDGDLVMDLGSISWTLDALRQDGVKVVSMHHEPIKGTLPKDNDLALVIKMNALRRHTFPEKYWLHGAYLGWSKDLLIEGMPLLFPAGKRVHEDNWLTAIIARDYGFRKIRVTRNYMARFLPPQTWTDYYKQQWRYQFAHEDLASEFPELGKYIPEIRKWTNDKYPEWWIDREWREACIAQGIDFDGYIDKYNEVLQNVRQGRDQSKKLLDENGVWRQQLTTKYSEKE